MENYKIITKKDLLTEQEEENKKGMDWVEITLMGLGFIPFIGEVADLISIWRYIRRKEYIYAAITAIALIPTIGDLAVKPFLFTLRALGISLKGGRIGAKALTETIQNNPKVSTMCAKVIKLSDHPKMTKVLQQVDDIPKVGKTLGEKIRMSIDYFKNVYARATGRTVATAAKTAEIQAAKGAIRTWDEVTGIPPVSKKIKEYFKKLQFERFTRKHGIDAVEKLGWFRKWWFLTYMSSYHRRRYIKQFIMSNRLLDTFGFPSFTSFQNAIQNDDKFLEKFLQNPAASELIGSNTSESEFNRLNQEFGGSSSSKSGEYGFNEMLKNKFTIGILKSIAQGVT